MDDVIPISPMLEVYRFVFQNQKPEDVRHDTPQEAQARKVLLEAPAKFMESMQAMEIAHSKSCASVLRARASAKGSRERPPSQKESPRDEGTDKAIKLANDLLKDLYQERARKDAEFAARPDAAKIGITLQDRLKGALEREERLKKRVEELEAATKPTAQSAV